MHLSVKNNNVQLVLSIGYQLQPDYNPGDFSLVFTFTAEYPQMIEDVNSFAHNNILDNFEK